MSSHPFTQDNRRQGDEKSASTLKKAFSMALLAGFCSAATLAVAMNLTVGNFSGGDLDGWTAQSFQGTTSYRLVAQDGRQVVEADSQGTASGLVRKIRVDLKKLPYLNWSWRVDDVLSGIDERTKAGDDYPARVYVIVSGGVAFWRTRTLIYVWSSRQPAGSTWENAFTGNAQVMALQSGKGAGWATERRDVRADFKACFKDDITFIDAVAIMTDTDNSKQETTAWYGDIFFSSE
ncbi:DUF3047 domain-containing protein [Desulfosarcina sp.]|uniref:DUF3047 domain-containing protein n=1 Tax=Desulfosarcina sp. TaxID=2027861 RepID=UPI003568DABE